MKIALLGYGKMGKVIEQIAVSRGHQIVLIADKEDKEFDITIADVAIEFSIPAAAVNNISTCIKNNVPVISGTTGWMDQYDDMVELCGVYESAFIYASNYSLGVNIFFELNKQLAKMMANLEQYKTSMTEIHHTQKLDAPSGTAITLAEGIIENSTYQNWSLAKNATDNDISIEAKRIENIPGTHMINYESEVDCLSISHKAHNRDGFALGAVIAAEWIVGKTGVFTMRDVLNIG